MRLKDILSDEQLTESIMNAVTDLFFVKKTKKVESNTKKAIKQEDPEPAEPFGGVCKYKNSVLIPDKPELYKNERQLVDVTSRMFMGQWMKQEQPRKCMKYIINHLIKLYISSIPKEKSDGIDMKVIVKSLESDTLNYPRIKDDYKLVNKIFQRIVEHRERLFDAMLEDSSNFKEKWAESKTTIGNVIENLVANGGEMNHMLGSYAAKVADENKKVVK